MRAVEVVYDGKPIESILRALHYDENLTYEEMAAVLAVPAGTVAMWMIRLGLNRTALADAKAKDMAS